MLQERVTQGSDIWIAESYEQHEVGTLGPHLLGTVELSEKEMLLPTHSIADGLYICGMAVEATFRRRGIGSLLVQAAEDRAHIRGFSRIYLHVERANTAAIALYEGCGFVRVPETLQHIQFTKALNLEHKRPLLLHKHLH